MAVFTTPQAEACKVLKCSNSKDGATHKHYTFVVEDPDTEFSYEWRDTTLVAAATDAQIETAIKDKLTATEKRAAPIVLTETHDTTIEGKTVGAIS